ncbi:MAG: hypothetical protein NTU89_01300 [Candidatus Dependentiae bacterium]|nr:hypothetical protein [Candidatus Dependentiae bacterium]
MKKSRVVIIGISFIFSFLNAVDLAKENNSFANQELISIKKKEESLSKMEMIESIRNHIQKMGFASVHHEVESLKAKPLMVVKDIYQQCKQQDLGLSIDEHKPGQSSRVELESIGLKNLDQQKSKFIKIPVVSPVVTSIMKNIQKIFNIPDGSQGDLLVGISKKLEQIGFSKEDIDNEISMLHKASVSDLKMLYPTLRSELEKKIASKSFYVDGKSSSVDTIAQMAHQWASTAAMVAVVGVSSSGYDSTGLTAFSTSLLLDPRLTYFNELTKTDFLELLYAHYDSYDKAKNLYLDPNYKVSLLMSREEMLSTISDKMTSLGFSKEETAEFIKNHQENSLQDMRFLYEFYEKLADQKANLSKQDKSVAQMNRAQLVKGISFMVKNVSKDKVIEFVKELKNLDLGKLQTMYQDLQSISSQSSNKIYDLPAFQSKTQQLLVYLMKNQPMIAEMVESLMITKIKADLRAQGKSEFYVQAKIKHLEEIKATPSVNAMSFAYLPSSGL